MIGEVAERSKALDWNSSNIFTGVRGFESHPLRQLCWRRPHPTLAATCLPGRIGRPSPHFFSASAGNSAPPHTAIPRIACVRQRTEFAVANRDSEPPPLRWFPGSDLKGRSHEQIPKQFPIPDIHRGNAAEYL